MVAIDDGGGQRASLSRTRALLADMAPPGLPCTDCLEKKNKSRCTPAANRAACPVVTGQAGPRRRGDRPSVPDIHRSNGPTAGWSLHEPLEQLAEPGERLQEPLLLLDREPDRRCLLLRPAALLVALPL